MADFTESGGAVIAGIALSKARLKKRRRKLSSSIGSPVDRLTASIDTGTVLPPTSGTVPASSTLLDTGIGNTVPASDATIASTAAVTTDTAIAATVTPVLTTTAVTFTPTVTTTSNTNTTTSTVATTTTSTVATAATTRVGTAPTNEATNEATAPTGIINIATGTTAGTTAPTGTTNEATAPTGTAVVDTTVRNVDESNTEDTEDINSGGIKGIIIYYYIMFN